MDASVPHKIGSCTRPRLWVAVSAPWRTDDVSCSCGRGLERCVVWRAQSGDVGDGGVAEDGRGRDGRNARSMISAKVIMEIEHRLSERVMGRGSVPRAFAFAGGPAADRGKRGISVGELAGMHCRFDVLPEA